MDAHAVEFQVPEGPILRGQRYGGGARWVVLVHDEGGDLDEWGALIGPLAGAGYCVLAFDLPGHGISDDPWEPAQAPAVVLAALGYAEHEGAARACLIGAGAGATAALVAAGTHPVRALVALSPRAVLDGVPAAAMRSSRAPKLIVVGSRDADAAAQAGDVNRRAIGWSVLEHLPVAAQGTDLLASEWGAQVREHVLAFLRDYL